MTNTSTSFDPLSTNVTIIVAGHRPFETGLIDLQATQSKTLFGADKIEKKLGYSLDSSVLGKKDDLGPPLEDHESTEEYYLKSLDEMRTDSHFFDKSDKRRLGFITPAHIVCRHPRKNDNAKKKPEILPHRPAQRFPGHIYADSCCPKKAGSEYFRMSWQYGLEKRRLSKLTKAALRAELN